METMIKNLKKGDLFKKSENAKNIFLRGDYNRFSKKYDCPLWQGNGNDANLKGNKIITTKID